MKIALSDNERKYILWAMEQSNGRINGPGGAAELLKINPSTLRFRIKKLGLKK
jgi:transcriptional regulator with GAF, ATPase, and Fis domain